MRVEESQEKLGSTEGERTHSTLWEGKGYTLCARKLTATGGGFCNLRNIDMLLIDGVWWLTTVLAIRSSRMSWGFWKDLGAL